MHIESQLDELRHELQHSAATQTAQQVKAPHAGVYRHRYPGRSDMWLTAIPGWSQSSMSERLGRMQEHVDVDSATAVEHTGRLSQLNDGVRRVEAALADAAAERQAARAEAAAKVNALAVDVAAINAETARVLELKADVAQVGGVLAFAVARFGGRRSCAHAHAAREFTAHR